MRLVDGFVTTQLVYVAAKLGIAEALVNGPRTSDELADAVEAEPAVLHRLMRELSVEGLFEEQADGRFALTSLD